jgi:hypothetical protein
MASTTYQLTTEPYMRRTAVQRRTSAEHSRSTQTHAQGSRGAVITRVERVGLRAASRKDFGSTSNLDPQRIFTPGKRARKLRRKTREKTREKILSLIRMNADIRWRPWRCLSVLHAKARSGRFASSRPRRDSFPGQLRVRLDVAGGFQPFHCQGMCRAE